MLRELGEADLVLCEDTRRTRVLLDRHGVRARLASFHRHNEAARTAEVLPRIEAGERVAVASDAGLPGVNDPGARLIAAAIERGVPVTVLPGPSAVETALVASGLVGDRYAFVGYLPRRRDALDRLWDELAGRRGPTVAFESPRRLPATLASLAAADPERPVAVCRELTKRFEEVVARPARRTSRPASPSRRRARSRSWSARRQPGRGDEAGRSPPWPSWSTPGTPRRTAAEVVARLTGLPRNRLYRGSL